MPSTTATQTRLSEEVLDLPIEGQNLGGAQRLRDLLGAEAHPGPTLLAFLRHFG